MAIDSVRGGPNELLRQKWLNGWQLFWLVTAPISLAMVLAMLRVNLTQADVISSLIQLSVRCAVPWLFLAFAASSLQIVFPSVFSRWLLRNRKVFGLCFAAAMAWQALFILWLISVHTDYFLAEVYVLSDTIEGTVGYTFLIAMTLTSFKFGRSRLSQRHWKLLHTVGIYWLWYYAWSVYWFNLFYYPLNYAYQPVLLDYVYYWAGFLAWGLRLVAWHKKRTTAMTAVAAGPNTMTMMTLGIAALAVGLVGTSFGTNWSPQVYDFLYGIRFIEYIEPFAPYSPLVPFYPMFLLMLGAFLLVRSRT